MRKFFTLLFILAVSLAMMQATTIDLSTLTEDYIAQNGDTLTGSTGYSVQIAADATITLSGVTITTYRKSPMECLGNATINLVDGSVNRIKDTDETQTYGRPALAFGPSGTTLTINGNTGILIANGGKFSPGIGCKASGVAYGGLVINGGDISAYGHTTYTNGIGAVGTDDNHGSSCGDITINGGTINASASDGVGIGAVGPNSCGAITINGGTITSHAVRSYAIGGNCSKVAISGGDINASTTTSVGIGSSGVVYIESGTIVASASSGEGVGISGDKGVLIRSSITSLTASKGPDAANAIQGATVYISANLNDVTEGNTRTLTPKASFDPEVELAKDEEGYYLIGNAQNWKEFAVLASVETAPKAKLVADIDLGDEQAIVGAFDGIFDGQGHTITINLTSQGHVWGLFRYVNDGAIIRNLHVAGTVNGAHRWIGGLVGEGAGTYYIYNCISSVTLNTTYSGDGVQGGFVAAQRGTLYMNDCIFDGVFYGPNAYTWGGFVGWYYGGSTLTNCLVLCDEYTVNMKDVATFVAMSGTLNNCYYKTAIGAAQGTQATTEQIASGVIAFNLQNNRADLVWGQRIGIDPEPVLTNDESYRVYVSKNGGYTNDPDEAFKQDEEGYYLLGSLMDWQAFAELVQTTPTANAKMTADIDLGDDQTHIGSMTEGVEPFYAGVFDGQGHTLTVHYVGESNQIVAPFTLISSATIKNLHVAGSIQSSYAYIGVVGMAGSGSVISKVWMSATMNTTQDGWVQSAAIAGYCDGSIQDCLFTGTYTSNGGGYMGGFYGYTSASPTITNCLSTGTFSQGNWQGNGIHTNCYFKQYPMDLTSGCSWVTDEQIASGVIAFNLQNNRADLVWGQRIGIDPEPVFTNDESYRVYKSKNGGYTNNPEEAYEGLQQDGDGNYLLGSLMDWQTFAELVQTTPAANAKMTADIDLGDEQAIIGAFNGTFDGQGHTLTVNLTSQGNVWGLFRYVNDGAIIRNLHVAGTVNGAHRWIGGLVGEGHGTYYIYNCISSVTLNTTYSGDGVQGGFVAAQRGTLYMNDCIFDGVFYGPNAYTWGGFVGWYYGGSTLTNCLSLCDNYNVSMTDVATFIALSGTLNNCYYKTAIGTAQGTQATEAELADGTTAAALQNGRDEEIWVQDPVLHTPMLKIFANADPSTPTAIDNTSISTKATKRIVNGQLVIEKNGKFYNATGAEVK